MYYTFQTPDSYYAYGSNYACVPSRLTVVSREAKEEVPRECLSGNAHEYFTSTNLFKIKNSINGKPITPDNKRS